MARRHRDCGVPAATVNWAFFCAALWLLSSSTDTGEGAWFVSADTEYEQSHHEGLAARIIGGQEAAEGRYPYAALVQSSSHFCGGALVAPDIVLSAAHCLTYNGEVLATSHERRAPSASPLAIEKQILHPLFDFITLDYDLMILKLNGRISSVSPIRINQDNDNTPQVGSILTVMGWGQVSPQQSEISDVLREATLTYISNGVCSEYWGEDAIHSSMMCATWGNGIDCNGDSGGPVILRGNNTTEDILVGLVSWGDNDCNNEEAPGVYVRLSDQFQWIRAMVCGHSNSPPTYMDCNAATATYSPSPSSSPSAPTFSPAPSVPQVTVTVVIDFDMRPYETGFVIETTADGTELISVLPGTYTQGQTRETYVVSLVVGQSYTITLLDSGGDGICCDHGIGSYAVFLGGPTQQIPVVSGTGEFGTYERHKFTTDGIVPGGIGQQEFVGNGTFPISVRVQPNESPHQLSWAIVRIDLSQRVPYARVPLGTYNSTVTQEGSAIESTVFLDEHGLYSFVLSGSSACCVSYDITIRDSLAGDAYSWQPLVTGTWNQTLSGTQEHTFVAQLPNASTLASPEDPPFLNLVLDFDEYPHEISWFVTTSSDGLLTDEAGVDEVVVAFGPQRRYDTNLAFKQLQTPIHLQALAPGIRREFNFIALDSAGDGLCCRYGRGSLRLYFGPVRNRVVLARSRLTNRERFETTFTLFGARPDEPAFSCAQKRFIASRWDFLSGLTLVILAWAFR